MADPLMSLVDTAFLGRYSVVALAALGPNAALFNVIFFISFMAMAVVAIDKMASANSSGNRAEVGRSFVLACAAAAGIGLTCAVIMVAFPEQVLRCFQTNDEIMPHAKIYCTIRALSTPFALLNVTFQAAFRALLDLNTPLVVIGIAGAVNLALTPLLIFPMGWGIAGAACATTVCQIFISLMFLRRIWLRRGDFGLLAALDDMAVRLRHPIKGAPRHEGGRITEYDKWMALLKDLPWVGFYKQCKGLALRAVLILSTYTAASMLAARLGTITIAAHQVIQQLQQLQLAVAWSFLSVGQTMIANVYNAPLQGPEQARLVGSRIMFWGGIIALVMAMGTWCGQDVLPRVFVRRTALDVLRTIAPAMLPACMMLVFSVNNALEGVLLGAGDANYVVGVYPPSVFLCLAFLGIGWHMGAGLQGIWWALCTYYASLVGLFALRVWPPLPLFRGPLHAS